jgi:hypothetical protein
LFQKQNNGESASDQDRHPSAGGSPGAYHARAEAADPVSHPSRHRRLDTGPDPGLSAIHLDPDLVFLVFLPPTFERPPISRHSGESLVNDATALVLYRAAVAALRLGIGERRAAG